MTEPQVTMTGPTSMRVAAADLRRGDWPETAAHLEKLAALWEAETARDAAALELQTSLTMKANWDLVKLKNQFDADWNALRAENTELRAALEAVKFERNGWYEYSESLVLEAHRFKNELAFQANALERARALLKRIEWQDATTRPIYCDIVVCVACGRDHPNHKPDCELAALLAAAPGGAA